MYRTHDPAGSETAHRVGAVATQPGTSGEYAEKPVSVGSKMATSVDTSNPAINRHRKTGHHAGELRLVSKEG